MERSFIISINVRNSAETREADLYAPKTLGHLAAFLNSVDSAPALTLGGSWEMTPEVYARVICGDEADREPQWGTPSESLTVRTFDHRLVGVYLTSQDYLGEYEGLLFSRSDWTEKFEPLELKPEFSYLGYQILKVKEWAGSRSYEENFALTQKVNAVALLDLPKTFLTYIRLGEILRENGKSRVLGGIIATKATQTLGELLREQVEHAFKGLPLVTTRESPS